LALIALAAKAQILKLGSGVESKLREADQFVAGTKNGTNLVYRKLNESMDSFVAAAVVSGLTFGDALNSFCSMKKSAMQRGVLKFEPKFLPAYD